MECLQIRRLKRTPQRKPRPSQQPRRRNNVAHCNSKKSIEEQWALLEPEVVIADSVRRRILAKGLAFLSARGMTAKESLHFARQTLARFLYYLLTDLQVTYLSSTFLEQLSFVFGAFSEKNLGQAQSSAQRILVSD